MQLLRVVADLRDEGPDSLVLPGIRQPLASDDDAAVALPAVRHQDQEEALDVPELVHLVGAHPRPVEEEDVALLDSPAHLTALPRSSGAKPHPSRPRPRYQESWRRCPPCPRLAATMPRARAVTVSYRYVEIRVLEGRFPRDPRSLQEKTRAAQSMFRTSAVPRVGREDPPGRGVGRTLRPRSLRTAVALMALAGAGALTRQVWRASLAAPRRGLPSGLGSRLPTARRALPPGEI